MLHCIQRCLEPFKQGSNFNDIQAMRSNCRARVGRMASSRAIATELLGEERSGARMNSGHLRVPVETRNMRSATPCVISTAPLRFLQLFPRGNALNIRDDAFMEKTI